MPSTLSDNYAVGTTCAQIVYTRWLGSVYLPLLLHTPACIQNFCVHVPVLTHRFARPFPMFRAQVVASSLLRYSATYPRYAQPLYRRLLSI
jgi:hypothetical protein